MLTRLPLRNLEYSWEEKKLIKIVKRDQPSRAIFFLTPILAIFLHSCNGNMMSGFTNSNLSNETQENYEEYSKPTSQLNKTRELLDGASINFPTLTATG